MSVHDVPDSVKVARPHLFLFYESKGNFLKTGMHFERFKTRT